MNLYNPSNLNNHIKYGEYDNKNNTIISPPHPSYPFYGTTFHNDEQLFPYKFFPFYMPALQR